MQCVLSKRGSLILTVLLPSEGHRKMFPAQGPHLSHWSCPFCPVVRLGSALAPSSVEFEAIRGPGAWGRWKQVTSLGNTARGSNRIPCPTFCGQGNRHEGRHFHRHSGGSMCRTQKHQGLNKCSPNGWTWPLPARGNR